MSWQVNVPIETPMMVPAMALVAFVVLVLVTAAWATRHHGPALSEEEKLLNEQYQ